MCSFNKYDISRILRNLCRRGDVLSVALLVFATHREMQRELQWLEVVDTCSKCVLLNYSRLIIVPTSGGEIYRPCDGFSVAVRFSWPFPAVTRAFYRRFGKATASP